MIEENRIEIVRTLEDVFASRGKKLNYRLTDKLIYNLQRIQQHKNTIPVYNKEYIRSI